MKRKSTKPLRLNAKAKAQLVELVTSWEKICGRLLKYSKRQAEGGDYWTAAENFMFSEGINVCAQDLRKILPD